MFSPAGATSSSAKKTASHIVDDEFGVVPYRRSRQARYVRVRVGEDGTVRASLPQRAPLYMVRELIESSRLEIRKLVSAQKEKVTIYVDGMSIGHSHVLRIVYGDVTSPKHRVIGQVLRVTIPPEASHDDPDVQRYVSAQARRALKREAMAYLPRRLQYLATQHGFTFSKVRFGNQKGRWGSCSSSGTISLNVALMNQPLDAIDYVLVHELAHTRHMNHSTDFWQVVEDCMPNYREWRKFLKTKNPSQ